MLVTAYNWSSHPYACPATKSELFRHASNCAHAYCDLDGVLASFIAGSGRLLYGDQRHPPVNRWEFFSDWNITPDELYSRISDASPDFWRDLPFSSGWRQAIQAARLVEDNFTLLTRPTLCLKCVQGKHEWVELHREEIFGLGCTDHSTDRLLVYRRKERLAKCPKTGKPNLLIDDSPENAQAWVLSGGIALLWAQPWNERDRKSLLSMNGFLS